MLGLHPHSGDHFTQSGKQREIVQYQRAYFGCFRNFWGFKPLEEVPTQSIFVCVVGFYDDAVMRRWGEGGDQCCIDCVLKTPDERGPDTQLVPPKFSFKTPRP